MRLVGRDYIFKIQGQIYLQSVFEKRKRYFVLGEPKELSRGRTAYFVFKSDKRNPEYRLVGEAKVRDASILPVYDKDYTFASSHSWRFVLELDALQRYSNPLSPLEVFGEKVERKIHQERPFGIDLQPAESKFAREMIARMISQARPDT